MATKRRATPAKRAGQARPVSDYDVAAVVGNDDPGGGDVVLVSGEDGRALLLPVRLRSMSEAQMQLATLAQRCVREHIEVLARLDRCVGVMREQGMSWNSIGWLTGLSADGARKRWGEDV